MYVHSLQKCIHSVFDYFCIYIKKGGELFLALFGHFLCEECPTYASPQTFVISSHRINKMKRSLGETIFNENCREIWLYPFLQNSIQ